MITPSTNPEAFADRMEKLERENKNLVTRIERMEKQRASLYAGIVGNVLLLVVAVLIVDYLGFLPSFVQRLPLKAESVETDELVLRGREGKAAAKLYLWKEQLTLTRTDASGQTGKEESIPAKP